jgi:RNA polymerase-binding transcription factor DksA
MAMATGWAGDGAVQDQIDATVDDAIARARRQLREGPGLEQECDAPIPLARRQAVPGYGCAWRASRRMTTKSRRMPATTGVAARTAS